MPHQIFVLFALGLMGETAGTLPVLGGFVENYMEIAKELLNATLRLRTAFSKWDMGCVGTGAYGIYGKNKSFKYPGTACPEGNIKGLYVDFSDPALLYFWDEKMLHKAPDKGDGVEAIHKIFLLLRGVKIFQSEVTAGVLTAFKFYGLPNGFNNSYNEAINVYSNTFGSCAVVDRRCLDICVAALSATF